MEKSFKIHGYDFADRLLEGCYFDVLVEISDDGNSRVISVVPDVKSASYCKNIKWENYSKAMGKSILSDLAHLQKYAACENRTLLEEFALFEKTCSQSSEWILTEV